MAGASDPDSGGRVRAVLSVTKDRCKSRARVHAQRGKRGVVKVITSEKVIQAFLTGSVVGAVTAFFEGWGVIIAGLAQSVLGLPVPAKWVLAPMLVVVFYGAFWADNNTERFREWVEDATGEEAADDEPE